MSQLVNFVKSTVGIPQETLDRHLWTLEGNVVRVKLSQKPDLVQKGRGALLHGHGLHTTITIIKTEDGKYHAFGWHFGLLGKGRSTGRHAVELSGGDLLIKL